MNSFSQKVEKLIELGVSMGALPHPSLIDNGKFSVAHDTWCRIINGGIECTCKPIISAKHSFTRDTYVLADKRTK